MNDDKVVYRGFAHAVGGNGRPFEVEIIARHDGDLMVVKSVSLAPMKRPIPMASDLTSLNEASKVSCL